MSGAPASGGVNSGLNYKSGQIKDQSVSLITVTLSTCSIYARQKPTGFLLRNQIFDVIITFFQFDYTV